MTKTGATGEALEGLTKSADNVFGTMPEDMSTVGEAIGEVNTRFHTTGTELEKTSKQFIQLSLIHIYFPVLESGQCSDSFLFVVKNLQCSHLLNPHRRVSDSHSRLCVGECECCFSGL